MAPSGTESAREKKCRAQGFLVNEQIEVSDDPSEFHPHGVMHLPPIACNNLRCARCGEQVRNLPQRVFDPRPPNRDELSKIYDIQDLSTVSGIKFSPDGRLYLCRCKAWVERLSRPLFDYDPDPQDPTLPPWSCHGHPPPTFPVEIDGYEITLHTDWNAFVGRVLDGWMPQKVQGLILYEIWIGRIYERLLGPPAADQLALAVGNQLFSGVPYRIGGAFQFYGRYGDIPGAAKLIDFIKNHASESVYKFNSLTGDRQVSLGIPLAGILRHSSKASENFNTCVALIKSFLTRPNCDIAGTVFIELAKVDPEWTAINLGHIAGIKSASWRKTYRALKGADEAFAAIGAVAVITSGNVGPEELKKWATFHSFHRSAHGQVVLQALSKL